MTAPRILLLVALASCVENELERVGRRVRRRISKVHECEGGSPVRRSGGHHVARAGPDAEIECAGRAGLHLGRRELGLLGDETETDDGAGKRFAVGEHAARDAVRANAGQGPDSVIGRIRGHFRGTL